MSSKTKNIFESVKLIGINEGSLGILSALSLALIVGGVTSALSKDKNERNRIQKVLTNALNNKPELAVLKEKLKRGTRVISANNLAKRVKISDKDKEIINNNDITILAMVDKKNNIIAYCIVDADVKYSTNIKYGYNIVDTSIPKNNEIKMFIQATFEFKMGWYGDGIKYYTFRPHGKCMYDQGKNLKDEMNKTANYVSKEEAEILKKELNEFANNIYNKLKNIITGVNIDVLKDEGEYLYCTLINDNLYNKYNNELDINDNDFDYEEKIINNIIEKMISILKPYGYTREEWDIFKSNIDKYKNIVVSFVPNDGEFGYYCIYFESKRKLNIK